MLPVRIPSFSRIALLSTACFLVACGGSGSGDEVAQSERAFELKLIGTYEIPTGFKFNEVEFGGISGIDHQSGDTYVLISDDRGGERGTPRFYTMTLDYDLDGFKKAEILTQRFMKQPDGSYFSSKSRTVDPEEIRIAPNGNYYWSSEGNWHADASQRYQPFVREMTPDGSYVRTLETPAMYQYVDNKTTGGINNKLFESMALTENGQFLYVANEDALAQDGPITSLNNGSVVRFTKLDTRSGKPVAQYAYTLPPIPVAPVEGGFADNGLSGMVNINDREFITIERAYAGGKGNTVRLMRAKIDHEVTDVSRMDNLAGKSYTPIKKTLLLEMPLTYQNVKIDNIEAITWGKKLRNGNRSLVLAVDNNFNPVQVTQFMAFEVIDR